MAKKVPQAFPSEAQSPAQPGMTLRDYFAIRLSAQLELPELDEGDATEQWDKCCTMAQRCYQMADAFVAVRDAE